MRVPSDSLLGRKQRKLYYYRYCGEYIPNDVKDTRVCPEVLFIATGSCRLVAG